MTTFKLAVASKEGISISEHFGHAKLFWIYQVSDASCELIEKRDVEHYCKGHHGSDSAMARILETIKDCHAVFIAKIGEGPADKLATIGVQSVADYAYEAIEPSLQEYVEKQSCGTTS